MIVAAISPPHPHMSMTLDWYTKSGKINTKKNKLGSK